MNVKLLEDRILAKVIEEDEETAGGVLIATASIKNIQKPRKGRILAIGPGQSSEEGRVKEMHVAVGDIILVKPAAWHDVTIEGEELFITSQRDVYAILGNGDDE